MLLNREEMIEELRSGIILVNFTKVNGEKRDMRCTLREDLLPTRDKEGKTPSHIKSDSVLAVYDTDAGDWRSFRLESVNHVFNPAPEVPYWSR